MKRGYFMRRTPVAKKVRAFPARNRARRKGGPEDVDVPGYGQSVLGSSHGWALLVFIPWISVYSARQGGTQRVGIGSSCQPWLKLRLSGSACQLLRRIIFA